MQIGWHDWWRLCDSRQGRARARTRTRTHKWPCIAADRRTVCAGPCIVCSSTRLPKKKKRKKRKTTSRAKSDLTFSNTESAERAGERDAERRERDGEAEVEGAGPRHERPPTRGRHPFAPPLHPSLTPPQPSSASPCHQSTRH